MPGKVPTKGQKQINQENAETLAFYRNISIAVSVVFAGVTILFYDLYWRTYIAMIAPVLVYLGCYKFMNSIASGGMDLSISGSMSDHSKDVLLFVAFVQTISLVSNYFWWLLLIIPARAFYMLWVNILAPWFFAPAPEQMLDEKQQKKLERKMKRQNYVYR